MFPARLNRILPWIFLATGILAVIQLVSTIGKFATKSGLAAWFMHHRLEIAAGLGAAAAIAWIVVWLGSLRRKNRLPKFLSEQRWLMDILDRLTNRAELERRLAENSEPIFVDADALAATLEANVVGQDKTCVDVAAQIRRRLALKQRGKPVGVFLFAGPPGVGKTWLGKVLADALGRKLLHFDMTQFSAGGFGATSLFGAAKGYVGSQEYGKLTAALRDTPDAVVLLDEIEKAHSDVHKNFLTAWNDGFITEKSDGKQISTTRTIFILTTNAAVDELADLSRQYAEDPDELRRAAVGALRGAGFAPEVLNRIDRIFVFDPLEGLDIARVAALEIERMISSYGLTVAEGGIDPEVLFDLMGRQVKMGAMASSRDLTRVIEESIADSLIAAREKGAKAVSLVKGPDGVRAEIAAAPAPTAPGVKGKPKLSSLEG
jgi:ATP-dependent Clp protease ATP-binding subunit ClpA